MVKNIDIHLDESAIDPAACLNRFSIPTNCGALSTFYGIIRDHNHNLEVEKIYYEAYLPLAYKELFRICQKSQAAFYLSKILLQHRLGWLKIGEIAVVIMVAAPHRDHSFRGCRFIIDELKQKVPIWKKEFYKETKSRWVNCQHIPSLEINC